MSVNGFNPCKRTFRIIEFHGGLVRMRKVIITLFIMCSVCAVASGEDETLPQSIYMKTLSRGFSYEYLYALKTVKLDETEYIKYRH
jgi:hypothetical protein